MVELNKANRKAPENDADLAPVRAGFGVLRLRLGPMSACRVLIVGIGGGIRTRRNSPAFAIVPGTIWFG
jgi:hypothetical protein